MGHTEIQSLYPSFQYDGLGVCVGGGGGGERKKARFHTHTHNARQTGVYVNVNN